MAVDSIKAQQNNTASVLESDEIKIIKSSPGEEIVATQSEQQRADNEDTAEAICDNYCDANELHTKEAKLTSETKVTMLSEITKPSETILDDKYESSCVANDLEKKAKLARKATELLLHLYSNRPPQSLVYPRDEDSGSEYDATSYPGCEPVARLLGDDDIIDCEFVTLEMFCHKRRNNYRRAKRERVPSKEKLFQKFCCRHETPGDIVLGKGTKKSIRVKFDRCSKEMSRNLNRKGQNERRKLNIEERLKKWGLKRRGCNPGGETIPGEYHIHRSNAPHEMQDMLSYLIALQDREVTPEDYELLLKLDDLIPRKTMSTECLQRLREDIVDESHCEEICGICMDYYNIGDTRKMLPCEHCFHSNCIEQWLSKSSTKCPLDGLEL